MTREKSRLRGLGSADGNRIGVLASGVSSAESSRVGVLARGVSSAEGNRVGVVAACVRGADGECVGVLARGVSDADSRGESVATVARVASITTAAVLAMAATVTVVAAVITEATPRSGRVVVGVRAHTTAVRTSAVVAIAPAARTLATRDLSPEDDDNGVFTGGVDDEGLGNVNRLDLSNVNGGDAGLGVKHPVLANTVVEAAAGVVQTVVATVPPAKMNGVTTVVAVGVRVRVGVVARVRVGA